MTKVGDYVRVTEAYMDEYSKAKGDNLVPDKVAWGRITEIDNENDAIYYCVEWITRGMAACDIVYPCDVFKIYRSDKIPNYVVALIAERSLLGELTNEGESE